MSEWVLADKLTVEDVMRHPVWEFIYDEEHVPDTAVRPVAKLPVDDLSGRLVGTIVTIASGVRIWAILSNVSLTDPMRTEQFLGLSITKNGRWFYLARYLDSDYEGRGPSALADFLGLPVSEVFPITYDLSDAVQDGVGGARGLIPQMPAHLLTTDELIALAVKG